MTKHLRFNDCPGQICAMPVTPKEIDLNVVILLTEGFSLISLASLTDVFNAVHTVSPTSSINFSLMSRDGNTVQSRSGVTIAPDCIKPSKQQTYDSLRKYDFCIICAGLDMTVDESDDVMRLVRLCQRLKMSVCAIGSAVWSIAMSGYIQKGTDHWTRISGIREALPHIEFENAIFVRDGRFISCAGELAAMDFALNWVGEHFDSEIAIDIRNRLLLQSSRSANQIQTCTAADRFKGVPEKLLAVIDLMLANIEEPLTINAISKILGISTRQIERIFTRNLSVTPIKFYRRQKLEHSLKLIEQTSMGLTEIALASGFSSSSMLNKLFKKEYGTTPTEIRSTFRLK